MKKVTTLDFCSISSATYASRYLHKGIPLLAFLSCLFIFLVFSSLPKPLNNSISSTITSR